VRHAAWLCAALLLWGVPGCADHAARPERHAWPDSFLARVEVLALLQTLNAELLSHDSATVTLERWCAVHQLATPARIVASRVAGADKTPSPEQRQELAVSATDVVRYRRVRLRCGALVLSEADNWYVPSRLSPAMNELLDTTDTPFGRVVQALHFQRHTLSSTLLWSPLPEGWEMNPHRSSARAGVLEVPAEVLQHRAVLTLPDGTPFSEVMETYTANVVALPAATRQ
jgi:chorismate-pyruvate lyase